MLITNDTQNAILDYLNHRKSILPNIVSQYKQNQLLIEASIKSIINPESVKIQKRIVRKIERENPITCNPKYRPVNNTARIYSTEDTPVALKKVVRQALCSGWTEVDLVAAQFGILATVLQCPMAIELAKSNKSVWRHIHYQMTGQDIEPNARDKKQYKIWLYSLSFGASRPQEKIDPSYAHIEGIPLAKEIVKCRQEYQDKLDKDKVGYDVWGNPWPVSNGWADGRWSGAVLASIIQSYEVEIIASIYRLDIYDYQIMLHLHDGLYIDFRGQDQTQYIEEMRKAVKTIALNYNISTDIEVKQL